MTSPTWDTCWQAGMTAHQAAIARNSRTQAAYAWSSANGKKWASNQRGNINASGQVRKLEPLWRDCWQRGLTARQAMAELDVSNLESAKRWANHAGVSWPTEPGVNTGYPNKADPPRLPPITNPADLDATACARMWACKIGLMLQNLTGQAVVMSQGARPRDVTDLARQDAASWFKSRDFAAIASMIGIDPEATRDRLKKRGAL